MHFFLLLSNETTVSYLRAESKEIIQGMHELTITDSLSTGPGHGALILEQRE
jgi:hypothetical protein